MSDNGEVKRQPKMGSPGDRRGFLIKLTASAGALGVAWCLRPMKWWGRDTDTDTDTGADTDAAPEPGLDPAVRRFLGSLRPGTSIDGRWTIEAVRGPRFGAIALLLRSTDGQRAQVDILAREDATDAPRPVATTRTMALYVSNRGKSKRPTEEDQGLATMALARELERREQTATPAPQLLTFRERRARHPLGEYSIV